MAISDLAKVLALSSFLTHTLSDLIDFEWEMFCPKFILFGFNVLYSKVTKYGEKRKKLFVYILGTTQFFTLSIKATEKFSQQIYF